MNIINYLKEKNYEGLTDFKIIRSDFNNMGIDCSYENSVNTLGEKRTDIRYIFFSKRYNRKTEFNKFCAEANGLILDSNWKPLVFPAASPKSDVNVKTVNNFLRKDLYNIYKLEDGTIVNLYFYEPENKWVIATAKGIDVGDKLFNTLTYTEIFNECLRKMNHDPETFFESLNKNACYSMGFKHPDMHPFKEGKLDNIYKLWFTQMTVFDHDLLQVSLIFKSPFKYIFKQVAIRNPKNISMLFTNLKNAYDDYADNNVVNYGYLFVAKNSKDFADNVDYNIVLLESKLMNFIRNLWYDASYVKYCKSKNFNRINTIFLNSFLDRNRIETFNILFPQYKEQFDKLANIEHQLVDKIYDSITGTLPKKCTPEVENLIYLNKEDASNPDKIISIADLNFNYVDEVPISTIYEFEDDTIDILCKQITDKVTIANDVVSKKTIRNIINSNNNIDLFYKIAF